MEDTVKYVRRAGESFAAFRGRERRERNDVVDALGLKDGDPIWNGKFTRFNSKIHTRSDRSYGYIKRLTPAETKELESREADKANKDRQQKAYIEQETAFRSRPEVQAAETVRYLIETDPAKIIDKLTPEEWIALRLRLEA